MINYSNKSDVLLAVAQDAELLQFLPKELGNDRDIFLAALKTRNVKSVFQFLPDILKHDRQFILVATEIAERSVLPYIRDEFKKDKEILLATLKKELVFTFHGYVSNALRNDPEFMLSAIEIHGFALTFASDELKKNVPFILELIEKVAPKGGGNDSILKFVSEELKNNHALVLAAVERYPYDLEHASESLRNNPEVVLAAVKKSGYVFQYASKELKNDPNTVLTAITMNYDTFEFASDELKNNPEFVLKAIEKNSSVLRHVPNELKNNRDFMLKVVAKNNAAFSYLPENMKSDVIIKEIAAIGKDCSSIFLILDPLKNKLKQIKNIQKKQAAQTLINSIEVSIVSYLKDSNYDLKKNVNLAVDASSFVLGEQSWWKKLIDEIVNAILSLFSTDAEKSQGTKKNRFSFFVDPNPLATEITQAQAEIASIYI